MSKPCVPFNKLKTIVLGGPGMSHKDIVKVWHKILDSAGITTHDKEALASLSQSLLDYWEANDGYFPERTPEQVVASCFRASIPANWYTCPV